MPLFAATALVVTALLVAEPAPAPLAEFSEAALLAHARFLASPLLRGRELGTDDEALAALYVATRLEARGVPALPSGEREVPVPVPFGLLQVGDAMKAVKGRTSRNVFGFVRGSDPALASEVIVLGAHIDHLGENYPGAEDNASGVAVVLEIAAALAENRAALGRSVLVAFFGAEEMGMIGSFACVEKPPADVGKIVAMVNVDMIGRPFVDQKALALPLSFLRVDAKKSIGVVGTKGRPAFRAVVNRACAEAGLKAYAPEDFPGPIAAVLEETTRERGDNWPFEKAGIPALFYGSGESDDYHRPGDTIEKLDPAIMASRAKAVAATVVLLSREPLGGG